MNNAPKRIDVWVCPDCGAWHSDSDGDYEVHPMYSGCGHMGHRDAEYMTYRLDTGGRGRVENG